ncbi:DUF4058 family protein [Gemmata sp.]|uniref:DUF4058 family protein n=1 Tax=Gemmata sp. TaxID=1914242 RepID=UPI003F705BAF
MPIHDWTRVAPGAYHDFHTVWLVAIRAALNNGLLPPGYYARAEQMMRTMGPDVLTLQTQPAPPPTQRPAPTATAAGRVHYRATATPRVPHLRQRRIGIRHASGDRLVAIIELVSPGNKAGRYPVGSFVRKVVRAVNEGVHALVIDPFPATRRTPHGLHSLIWEELGGERFDQPADQPLTLAAYEAADPAPRCYVEPVAAGQPLPDMPLFLEPDYSIDLPVEATYLAAWAAVVPQDRALLEPPAAHTSPT